MDPARFFAASRVVIVAGKGGVGKTVVSATLARAAARIGLSALIVEVEGKSGLATMFGQGHLDYDEATLFAGGGPAGEGEVRARTLTPDEALLEYLATTACPASRSASCRPARSTWWPRPRPGIKDILDPRQGQAARARRRAPT